ncbi:MAG: homoserine kinase [Elusimicrobia bacterium RIFOXYA2_FULL_40_6]|nr:MAG: homoserine kinase [Elusimicrobia bacterium RIFOXYA2_FULL_40_6]
MKFRVRIPATTTNFGPGFDVLGMALNLYNEIEVTEDENKSSGCVIEIIGEGENSLPKDNTNILCKAMSKVFQVVGLRKIPSLKLKLFNRIPLASGLGSSAAARVGGMVAANYLCGNKLPKEKMLEIAAELEGHPDNVAPAIFGGLCISYSIGKEVKCVKIVPPQNLDQIVCVPDFELPTKKARKILPEQISRKAAVYNISRTALLIDAFVNKRYDLLSVATQDMLHQPFRKKFIPGFDNISANAIEHGALGVFLSGSGPSIMALSSSNRRKSGQIADCMRKVFKKHRIDSKTSILSADTQGAKII